MIGVTLTESLPGEPLGGTQVIGRALVLPGIGITLRRVSGSRASRAEGERMGASSPAMAV